jgi:hypothetical protein
MNKRKSKGKQIKPTFFVFCEGETEDTYIKYLRSTYRLSIEIDSKIAGNKITGKYISNYKKSRPVHLKDKTFLVYDGDVEPVLQKLQRIKNAYLLCSNPCFEFWYLLHCQKQTASLTSEECISKLKQHIRNYKKGVFDDKLKNKIIENKDKSVSRAKTLTEFSNPSTTVYKLVEALNAIKKSSV